MTTSALESHSPRHRGRTGRSLPPLYVLAGAVVLAGYYFVPGGRGGPEAVWKVALYCLVSASAVGAIFIGIRRNRPTRPLAWYLVLVNQAIYASGDVTFYIRHDLLKLAQYPSVSDVLYLLHYPVLIAAVVIFIRRRAPGGDRAALIDAGVLAVTAAMLSWIFVIAPAINSPGQDALARATSAAYPIMDVIMLAMALWLLVGTGRRTRSFWLLGAALVLLVGTDTTYALQQIAGTYHPGGFLDGMWGGYYLLIGASALDPSMVHLGDPLPAKSRVPSATRFIGLGFAAVAVPGVLLIEQGRNTLYVFPVIAAGTALLFVLVILRLMGMVSEQRRIAVVDLLTGLRNRRFFESHYEIDCSRAERSGQPLSMVLFDIDFFKSVNDGFGHAAGDPVLSEIADRMSRGVRAGDVLARYGVEEFAVLLPGAGVDEARRTASRLSDAINSEPFEISRDLEIQITVSAGVVTYPDHVLTPTDLAAAADRALYAAKSAGRDRLVVGNFDPPPNFLRHGPVDPVVNYLETLADLADAYQAPVEHGSAIARWAVAMANELGLDEFAQRRCDLAARLHDVGKIAVPMHILTKTEHLSREEWRFIRDHPAQGELLVSAAPGMREIAAIIVQHHEQVDGSGYPKGLLEGEIRIEAKILSVCDAFASMRADRPYRPGLSEEESRARLLAARGTQLAAPLVDLFVRLLDCHVVGHLGHLGDHTRRLPDASTIEKLQAGAN
jgi:two-component system, cell cycle response regulator